MTEKYHDILRRYWGFESFRDKQLQTIESVCSGRDTLVLMPTGAGKSLLYQLPALAMEGTCVVVTPLIALMKDQVDRLKSRGISAVAIHSGMSARQIDIALDNCVYGDVKFLYVAPERISSELFRMRVMRMKVSLIAIDEAHCISQWGYDFRPSYLKIAELRKVVPDAGVLALTASATQEVVEDIQRHLLFRNGTVFRTSFSRPNLSYIVRRGEDKLDQLMRIVNNVNGTGIVYVRTRDGAEQLAQLLKDKGVTADFYHGGLTYVPRSDKQEAWSKGRCRIMVATNAFGMGIDKADVRFVVHYDSCDSIEEYYQEAGRAGRDGKRSYAVLLLGDDEHGRASRRFATEYPPIDTIKSCYESIFNFLQIGIGDGKYASFEFNLFEFARRCKIYGTTAMNAIKILQQNGYMILTDAIDRLPRLMFSVNRDDLYKVRIEREELDHILRVILRLYDGVFHNFVPIDIAEIATATGYEQYRVRELLKKLWDLRIIRYMPATVNPLLVLTEERLPIADVVISPESYRIRKDMAAERLESFFAYADNETECRSVVLQRYFGEDDAVDCGCCDMCLDKKRANKSAGKDMGTNIDDQIVKILRAEHLSIKELVARFRCDSREVVDAIDRLRAAQKISVDSGGKVEIIK